LNLNNRKIGLNSFKIDVLEQEILKNQPLPGAVIKRRLSVGFFCGRKHFSRCTSQIRTTPLMKKGLIKKPLKIQRLLIDGILSP